jgi:hypothetical protein
MSANTENTELPKPKESSMMDMVKNLLPGNDTTPNASAPAASGPESMPPSPAASGPESMPPSKTDPSSTMGGSGRRSNRGGSNKKRSNKKRRSDKKKRADKKNKKSNKKR